MTTKNTKTEKASAKAEFAQHTPGEWELRGGKREGGPNVLPRWALYVEEFPDTAGQTGCGIVSYSCNTFAYLHASEADARLMVSAPDLLAALLNIEANLTGKDCPDDRISDSLRRAKAAIARAEGRQP